MRESFCESDSDCITHSGPCEYNSCSYRIDIAYMIMITLSLFGPFFILSWRWVMCIISMEICIIHLLSCASS